MIKAIKSFESIVERFYIIDGWIKNFGIITENTRFKKLIYSAELLYEEENKKQTLRKFDFKKLGFDVTSLPFEIGAFIDIYESFENVNDKDFVYSLRQIVNGPTFSKEENNDTNVHRNHLFEIRLAAKLASKQIKIKKFEDIVF